MVIRVSSEENHANPLMKGLSKVKHARSIGLREDSRFSMLVLMLF